jgi:pyruvate dehydrogenase E1 component alpha subunit
MGVVRFPFNVRLGFLDLPRGTHTVAKQAEKKLPYSPAELEKFYREMLFIRVFEEKCNVGYRLGKAGGYMHVYIGMEALALGWMHSIKKGYDYVITAYRDHAHPILLGTDPTEIMAEIFGRSGGTSRGKGGSMHIYDADNGFFWRLGHCGREHSAWRGLSLCR